MRKRPCSIEQVRRRPAAAARAFVGLAVALAAGPALGQAQGEASQRLTIGQVRTASGEVARLVGSATSGQTPAGRLGEGASVHEGEGIGTGSGGGAQVALRDGSLLVLGDRSRLRIDAFAHDAAGPTSLVHVTFEQGSFRFVHARADQKGARTAECLYQAPNARVVPLRVLDVPIDVGAGEPPAKLLCRAGETRLIAARFERAMRGDYDSEAAPPGPSVTIAVPPPAVPSIAQASTSQLPAPAAPAPPPPALTSAAPAQPAPPQAVRPLAVRPPLTAVPPSGQPSSAPPVPRQGATPGAAPNPRASEEVGIISSIPDPTMPGSAPPPVSPPAVAPPPAALPPAALPPAALPPVAPPPLASSPVAPSLAAQRSAAAPAPMPADRVAANRQALGLESGASSVVVPDAAAPPPAPLPVMPAPVAVPPPLAAAPNAVPPYSPPPAPPPLVPAPGAAPPADVMASVQASGRRATMPTVPPAAPSIAPRPRAMPAQAGQEPVVIARQGAAPGYPSAYPLPNVAGVPSAGDRGENAAALMAAGAPSAEPALAPPPGQPRRNYGSQIADALLAGVVPTPAPPQQAMLEPAAPSAAAPSAASNAWLRAQVDEARRRVAALEAQAGVPAASAQYAGQQPQAPLEGSVPSRAPRTLGSVGASSVEPSLTGDIPAADPGMRRSGRATRAEEGGDWGVQLGAFANAGNGQRYAAALRARGVAAEAVSGAGLGRPDMTVVVAGRYAGRSGADAAAATLRRQLGTPVLVVRR